MKRRSLIIAVILVLGVGAILVVIASNRSVEPPHPSTQARHWTANRPISPPEGPSSSTGPAAEKPPTASSGPRLVWSANTGDVAHWPSYDAPLVIHVDAPEVPPKIAEVAPPITEP